MDWKINSDQGTVRSGSVRPSENIISIAYDPLSAGDYILTLSGNTCRGKSKPFRFTVPKSLVERLPGKIDPDDIIKVPGVIDAPTPNARPGFESPDWHFVARTDTQYLDIEIKGLPGKWLIYDIAPTKAPAGHEERYFVNGVMVKGRLNGYKYESNGVLDVVKHFVKISLPSLGYWQNDNIRDGGWTFSPRSDVGCQAIIFFSSDDNKPGLQWLDPTPSWYRGTHVVSWPTAAPAMSLPDQKYMMFDFRASGVSDAQRMARGETFTPSNPDNELRNFYCLNTDDANIEDINGSREDFRRYADRIPLMATLSFQFGESARGVPDVSDRQRWFVERLYERYKEAGRKKFLLSAGYGGYDYEASGQWPSPYNNVSLADARLRYSGNVEDIFSRDKYLSFFRGKMNTILLKNYETDGLNPFSNLLRVAKYESVRAAGFLGIEFGWHLSEHVGVIGFVRGFGWQHELPAGGTAIVQGMSATNFDDALANGFASLWWGDGFRVWDGQAERGYDPATVWREGDYYGARTVTLSGNAQLTGSGSDRDPVEPDIALDGKYISATLYAKCAATEGAPIRYNAFTVAGTSYIAEPDGADALVANSQKRGICSIRIKGKAATLVYWNPYAGNVWTKFETMIEGKVFGGWVFGRRIYVANVTI